MSEKVDQDIRKAAAELGLRDANFAIEILARVKAAGRRQGLRDAAEALKPAMAHYDADQDEASRAVDAIEMIRTALMDGEGK